MAIGRKIDFDPLLPPGRHYCSLEDVHRIAVHPFPDNPRRRDLFSKLERMLQDFLLAGVVCEFHLDGSFLTKKVDPDDLDLTVIVEHEFINHITPEMQELIDEASSTDYFERLSSSVYFTLPYGDKDYRTDHDLAYGTGRLYGQENSEEWRKGYVILPLNETNVGLRIRCR